MTKNIHFHWETNKGMLCMPELFFVLKTQVARFANLSEAQLRQILAERHLLGTGENCKLPAVCLLQLHRAQRRKHYFEQSKPLITSGL